MDLFLREGKGCMKGNGMRRKGVEGKTRKGRGRE